MRTAIRLVLWLVAALILPAGALAQRSVLVTLFRPPENELRVADLWRVDLQNLTDTAHTIYLHGFAEEDADGRIVDARSRTFVLAARARVRVTGSMLEPITVDEWNEEYKTILLRSGKVPTGSYHVCVEVIQVSTGDVIGSDCYTKDIEIEQLTPPILVFPLDEGTVTDRLPTFNWLPPTPVRSGDRISYQLRIVEMLGRQTPYDAMASNPAFFDYRDITTNSFRYPLGARGFVIGRDYAWQIRAFLAARYGQTVPVGESEVWRFTYGSLINPNDPGLGEDDGSGRENRDPVRGLPPLRGRDITTPVDADLPTNVGRNTPPVIKDLSIRPGFIPPNIDLNDIVAVKPTWVLNPMVLRALMHTCQGGD